MALKADDQQPPTLSVCRLLAHEMVHVIQHWHDNFEVVIPLGWPTNKKRLPIKAVSLHEAEAFTAQWHPRRVMAQGRTAAHIAIHHQVVGLHRLQATAQGWS